VKIGAAEPAAVVTAAAIVKWVSENNALGAGSPIGDDMGKLAENTSRGKERRHPAWPGLMKKSARARGSASSAAQLYVVQYTDAQTKQAGCSRTMSSRSMTR